MCSYTGGDDSNALHTALAHTYIYQQKKALLVSAQVGEQLCRTFE